MAVADLKNEYDLHAVELRLDWTELLYEPCFLKPQTTPARGRWRAHQSPSSIFSHQVTDLVPLWMYFVHFLACLNCAYSLPQSLCPQEHLSLEAHPRARPFAGTLRTWRASNSWSLEASLVRSWSCMFACLRYCLYSLGPWLEAPQCLMIGTCPAATGCCFDFLGTRYSHQSWGAKTSNPAQKLARSAKKSCQGWSRKASDRGHYFLSFDCKLRNLWSGLAAWERVRMSSACPRTQSLDF